jgi:tetratricopeptide (TPR) repeat protein
MDEQVGRLLDALGPMGLQSRTLVAAIGDHGESLGEHGELTHGIFLYDSTLHVPFLLAGPDVPPGKVIDDQVRSIDVMPTLLDLLNLPPGPEVEGVSLWPLIRQGTHVRSNYSYSETLFPRITMGWSELRAMRTDRWKLIAAPHPELYNLELDPGEAKNLISSFPADADQLQKKIWEVAGVQSRQEKVSTTPLDPQTRQELESLGYVSAGTPRQIQLGTTAPDPKDRVATLKVMDQTDRLIEQKAYARAAQILEQNWRFDPTNPRFHTQLAMAYESMGQYPRAIAILEDAVKQHVETDRIFARLGIDYTHLGQHDKALDALARAAELNPSDLDNLLNLGMTYTQLNRLDDGERTFKAMIAQNDRDAAAYTGLGLVAAARQDMESARRNFEKTLSINPDDPQALLDLGILYQKTGDKPQALRYLQLFLDKAPHDQFGHQFADVREAIQDLKGH